MKNLITRTLTGLIYVVLLIGCTVCSPVTAFFFFGFVAAAILSSGLLVTAPVRCFPLLPILKVTW